MLRNKLMTACSVALLTAALYGCSSSSDDGANMKVQDLEDQIAALSAELGEGEELTPEALAALIAAKDAAVAALAAAMTAHEAALAAAAMEAMTAHEAALAAAAVAAEAAKVAALAAAAVEAEAAKVAALEAAAMEAMTAHEAALAAAAVAAADLAAADKQAALDAAEVIADAAQVDALAAAKVIADAAQVGALAAAKVIADAAQVDALDAAKVIADAALKMVQDDLDELEEDLAEEIAAGALKEKFAREASIKMAIEEGTPTNRVGTAAKAVPTGITATDVIVKRTPAGMVTVDVNGATDDVYAGGETTAGSGNWNSVTMTKTNSDVAETTDTLVIYTDIDEPADVDIETVYTDDSAANLLDAALAHGDDMTDVRYGKAQSDDFPSGPGVTLTYGTGGLELTVLGTFDGVPGAFKCTDDPCMVSTDDKGKLKTSMDWRFTPASPLDATVKVPDANYAYFGWWLNKPKENDDTHDVEVFAGGTNVVTALAAGIVGNARYSGPAAGKYVTKTFTAGAQTDAGVGHFTANANLTAKFGDDANAAADGTIGGSVTGFELDDGSNPGWTVKLEDAPFTGDGTFDGTTEVNFGGGLTDGDMAAGTWQGAFYGAGAEVDDAPDAVAGTFDAVTENAAVIGGFGATKQ